MSTAEVADNRSLWLPSTHHSPRVSVEPAELMGRVGVFNTSGAAVGDVASALERSGHSWAIPVAAALQRWTQETRSAGSGRMGPAYLRDRYLAPDTTFGKIAVARDAARTDDIVGGVLDMTESVLFRDMTMHSANEEEQDAWDQWASAETGVDLAQRFREAWRTLFTDSQVVVGQLWGRRSWAVRGTTPSGAPHRKRFDDVWMPTDMTIIDTTKVVPVGTLMFGRERLAYVASTYEADRFDQILSRRDYARSLPAHTGQGIYVDEIVDALVERRYEPDDIEAMELGRERVDFRNLYLLRAGAVWRHTLTRPGYQRFADVRMESVFELLDLKHQLRHLDRTWLLGGINALVLIKKGTDAHPAEQEEVDYLRGQEAVIARLPVIVSDHRLSVEIVSPDVEHIVNPEKWDVIDRRIRARLLQMLLPEDDPDPVKVGKVVSEALESRRSGLRAGFHRDVLALAQRQPGMRMPAPVNIEFWPDQISLAFDEAWASFMLELRQAKEISRDTILGNFGFSQAREAVRRQREKERYDDIFGTINPYGPQGEGEGEGSPDPRSAGRGLGGNRNGGGRARPGSGQGKEPRNPRRKSD